MHQNIKAFLDMIGWSELGPEIISQSDNGYNVLAGSLPGMVLTFSSYHKHPGALIDMDGKSGGLESTAAGKYQILGRIWKAYKEPLRLKGFWPEDQDKVAVQLIRECKAANLIENGKIIEAVNACKSRWASLPGAGYSQHEHRIEPLLIAYRNAGGTIA